MCFCPFGAYRLRLLTHPPRNLLIMWLRGGGCVGMAGMPYPPINTSAPTDADVCADRCGCLRRPMRMSAPTDADVCVDRCGCLHRPIRMSASNDADVCVDRCEPCREGFLALASGKAERSPSFYHIISSTI